MLETAALLLLLLGVAHAYLGERYLLMRLARREDSLPRLLGSSAFTLGTLRFVWHLIALPWGAMAWLLWLAAQGEVSRLALLQAIGVALLASALLPLLFTRGRHLSWVAFLLAGALVLGA
ncbi:hypothetical protein [Inhella sp.]|uniref:hypothetical protein n=1 Tax=Inhella sp. TaxID=1921806 RepID=UPI0035B0A165